MWRTVVVLTAALAVATASASAVQESRDKKTSFGPGLATIIGTLGILKIKAVFLTLIVLAVAAVFSKLLGCNGVGGDLGCGASALLQPSGHSSYSGSYDTYNSGGGGGYNYYNHKRSAEGWDLVDMSLEMIGLESEDCKKKFVCMADNEAIDNPLLLLVMKAFGSSLGKYRDVAEGEGSAEAAGPRRCDKLYPKCSRRVQPQASAAETDDKPTNKLPPHVKAKLIRR